MPESSAKVQARDTDPWAILADPRFDRAAKLERLRQLEYDARQIEAATGEGMPERVPQHAPLAEILAAMAKLGGAESHESTPTRI